MTAICAGGTSSSKLGFGSTVALTVPAIAALLNNVPTAWAVPFAAYLGLINYDLSTFCSADPPSVPTITAGDAAALLTILDPVGHTTALLKFQQLVGAYMWYRVCECDTVPTPAPPAPPSAPTGLPDINPPAVAPPYPTGLPCATAQIVGDAPGGHSYGGAGYNPIGGATSVTLSARATGTAPTVGSHGFGIGAFTAARVFITQLAGFALNPAGITYATVNPVPANTAFWAWSDNSISGYDGVQHYECDLAFYCGGAPGGDAGPVPTPCPPDQFTLGILQQILELVTLIQRYHVPFAYINGSSHVGLTGAGSFAISRLLGMQVHVTAHTSTRPDAAGNPSYVWDQGWMSVMDDNGMIQEKRISQTDFVWFPQLMQEATTFGYSLNPGTTATFQELLAEP